MNDDRVYFIGAGASKQDRFPLTSELKHGIAWAILQDPARFGLLGAHLNYRYNVGEEALVESASAWTALQEPAPAIGTHGRAPCPMSPTCSRPSTG